MTIDAGADVVGVEDAHRPCGCDHRAAAALLGTFGMTIRKTFVIDRLHLGGGEFLGWRLLNAIGYRMNVGTGRDQHLPQHMNREKNVPIGTVAQPAQHRRHLPAYSVKVLIHGGRTFHHS